MKYLKLYENKILDDILDKISEKGKDSLTSLELDYLNNYYTSDKDKYEKEINKTKELKDKSKYDPREDKEFFDKVGMDFGDWSDKDIDDGKLHIIWDKLSDELMNRFIKSNDLDDEISNIAWQNLDTDIKELFQVFLYENDIIKSEEQEEIELSSLWDILNEDDIMEFLERNQLPFHFINKQWDNLPNEIKHIFKQYANKKNLL
ncbi:hypothetical protein [Trichloromonas sp.]|uniref:hypothetical protein n=1 Tax=Trichloromonas sp. TaxID=3069249 RepID=UPI002A4BCF80|nr:hypothetical protein [Trichloromonas sp.]